MIVRNCDTFLTSSVRRAILKASAVSFDVFDTLLTRPYCYPTDLFLHIEHVYNCPGFRDGRIAAEITARNNTHAADVTLDDIYEKIDKKFCDLKQVELDWEKMVLRANPKMKEVYDFACRNNKIIIIASDMYLPSKFIADVLHKNGYKHYDKLYVSGEMGVTKHKGTMFDRIVKDINISPHKILHIGDNHRSDYKKPREHGLCAIKYQSPIHNFIDNNTRIKRFCNKTQGNLGASILVAMATYRNQIPHNNEYWYNLGYEYGGPIIYGYTRWIQNVANKNKINHLMFVARDGYTLQKIFNTFDEELDSSYIYAPRFLNLIYRLQYRHGSSSVALAQQKTIIDYYKTNDKIYQKYIDYDFKHKTAENFIEDNFQELKLLADKNFKLYKDYLASQFGLKQNKIALVDTITENFSAQNLITAGLSNRKIRLTGFYWYIYNYAGQNAVSFVATSNIKPVKYIKNWGLMELLMTSPEYPIEGITKDFKPIYKQDITPEEKHIREIYPDISMGSVNFAEDVKSLFNGADIYLDYDCLVNWINCFCDTPDKQDFIYMEKIKTSSNPNNDIYESLFRSHMTFSYKLRHPLRYYKKVKSFAWTTPFERLILSITHPIKIHTRGLKNISIYILPKMKHGILHVTIKIFSKYVYQLIIGAKDEI